VKLTNQNETFDKKLKAVNHKGQMAKKKQLKIIPKFNFKLEERMQMNQQNFGENENQNCLPKNQMKMCDYFLFIGSFHNYCRIGICSVTISQ
jgi:hypothetical protein